MPVAPPRDPFVPWMGAAVSEIRAALADGDHYREMANRLRGLARLTRSPGIRRELVDLAGCYDRRGDRSGEPVTVENLSGAAPRTNRRSC